MAEKETAATAEGGEKSPAEGKPAAGNEGKGISFGLLAGVMGGFLILMFGGGFALAYFVVPKQVMLRMPAPPTAQATESASTGHAAEAPAPPKESHSDGAAPAAEAGGHGAQPAKKVDEFLLNELLVNVAGTRGARYCKVSLAFDAPPDVLGELEAQRARVVDIVSEVLSSKSMEEVTSPSARGMLRTQFVASVNTFLKKGQIQNIYFLDFVIQ